MKNLFLRALATRRPLYWLRLVWRAKSSDARQRALDEYGPVWVEAFEEVFRQIYPGAALPKLTARAPVPEPFEGPRARPYMEPPRDPRLPLYRSLTRSFCANHCGLGFVGPNATPAKGFFWKQDREGFAWRLYREGP